MPAIVAPRATLPRSYPATPLVAAPDGARLTTAARAAIEQLPLRQAPGTKPVEPTPREPVGGGFQSAGTGGQAFLPQSLAQSDQSDQPARSLHRQASTAYMRMRDSHIQLLPGFARIDITV